MVIQEMTNQVHSSPKPLTILTFGDNPLVSTGYGTVWNNLLTRWVKEKPDWKFLHVGWQNRDRLHQTKEGYWMLPMGNSEYGYDVVVNYLIEHKPDVFMTLCDVGYQSGYIKPVNLARQMGWTGKWIAYTPIDTHGWAITWNNDLGHSDVNVAMAQFGEIQMKKHQINNVVMIPHGVDTKTFKPLKDRENLKEKYNLKDKFVIGFVGRNQIRKMPERLLMGFTQFAQNKDDVVLLLHTDSEPTKDGISLRYLLPQLRIQDKVKLTKKEMNIQTRQNISEDTMNEIYNVMDVFGYPTGGEGFGLPALEAQSSGVPLLMTACSTAFELCREKNLIPVLKDPYGRDCKFIGTNGVYFMYPDDVAMAKLFEEKYNLWKEGKLEEEREDARDFALKYEWDLISPQFLKLFENVQ